jgi:hypothetical protein
MSMNWTPEQLEERLKENPDLKIKQENPLPRLAKGIESQKPHKYHAQRTEYNGVRYASKKEANYARELDQRELIGEFDFWLRQVPLALPGGIIYRIDFVTFKQIRNTPIYEVHWIEVKGYRTQVGEIKRRQAEEIYHITVEVV